MHLLDRRWVRLVVAVPLAVLGALAIAFVDGRGGPDALRTVLATVYAAVLLGSAARRDAGPGGLGVGVALFFGVSLWWATREPRDDREWEETQSRAPWAEIDGTRVTIHDVRDFRYRSADDWDARWYDRTYDVARIERAYFVLTRFAEFEGVAHVMVSFRFADGAFVVLSAEIRRERGESYDPLAGLFRQYELMYVAADERDAIGLRTLVHDDPTWVIPVDAGPEATGAFFLDMVERMNRLHGAPEWYDTLGNSCATNLARHYESVNDVRLPPDWRVALPGFSDRLVEELGLLPEGMSREEATRRFLVNEAARRVGLSEAFSTGIRAWE